MANSARAWDARRLVQLAILTVTLGGGLAGCVTTQQKAAWLHIVDARIIAAQNGSAVPAPSRTVRVRSVSLLRRGAQLAVVVTLRNLSSHTQDDLPILVGVRTRAGHIAYLNRATTLSYFQSHVSTVPGHATVAWVLSTRSVHVPAGRTFAVVGARPVPEVYLGHSVPQITATVASKRGRLLRVRLSNPSSIPQPELQLYAIQPAGVRVAAAGSTTVPDLGAGQTAVTQINLIGRPDGPVHLEALPTMFLP